MQMNFLILYLWVVCSFSPLIAQTQNEVIYKKVDSVQLKMVIYHPESLTASDNFPALIFFFGGGWETGNKLQFQYYALNYAKKGLVTVLADYRISSVHGTTPIESLKDAKSAVRYLKQHAKELQIDTMRLIASGGSAGGQLAAACFTNETFDEATDPLMFSAKPKALVLFNPAVDNSESGNGYEKLGDKWEEFSPLHNIKEGFPPTIFLLGTKDNLVTVATGMLFKQKIEAVGGRCDLKLYKGAKHGFFNLIEYRNQVVLAVDTFLQSIGCLPYDKKATRKIAFP